MAQKVSKGDLVKLNFDPVNGSEDSHKGQVIDVEKDPEGYGNTLFVEITDMQQNSTIHYFEGEADGDNWKTVSRVSTGRHPVKIGRNAEITVVG